ncbi:MAG: hypothetical protein GXY83_09835 [Rhodopirellula sp.]|nr:hypothetical protein [Rhodopirellula sp.]
MPAANAVSTMSSCSHVDAGQLSPAHTEEAVKTITTAAANPKSNRLITNSFTWVECGSLDTAPLSEL